MLKITQGNLKKVGMILMLIGIVVFSILMEFMSADFDLSIFCDVFYWTRTISINLAVICVLFSVRSLAKDKERQENDIVKQKEKTIEDAYVSLNKSNLNTEFENYISAENARRKKTAYINLLRRKLKKCKSEKAKGQIFNALKNVDSEYDIAKVKYAKVRFSTIFGKVNLHSEDDDLEEHEGRDYFDILVSKILAIFAFALITNSFVFETYTNGWVTMFNISSKLVQISIGIYMGAVAGSDYIKGNLSSRLTLRINFVQRFLEQHRTTDKPSGE